MSKTLPVLLLLLLSSAFAQTPAYTTSVTFGCNQSVCNGIPLDQGGTWQFIEANRAFSVVNCDSTGDVRLDIYGYPGNPLTYYPSNDMNGQPGGMYNIVDQIPQPPSLYLNGSTGAVGTLTFSWEAISNDGVTHYFGHAAVTGQRVRHYAHSPRGSGGYYTSIVVTGAQIYIDSVN